MDWYKYFLQQNEQKIIQKWMDGCEREYPHQSDLHRKGIVYFGLLTDIHIPIEEHPLLEFIPQMCRYHAEKRTPIKYLVHSLHIWRESIMEYLWSYCVDMNIPVNEMKKVVPSLQMRLDNIQRRVCNVYWEHENALLEQKDQTISQLHNDRLTILGKVAASMAHELRNPLTAIEGFIKLIRSEMNSKSFNLHKVNGFLDVIQAEFKGLYGQITGFLSFSKNGGIEEPYTTCTSKEVIDTVVELASPRLINENIEITTSIQCNNPFVIQKVAIQQVLFNLINNSIDVLSSVKYSKLIAINTYEDDMNYYIDVIDNGTGIPQEIQDTIFTPFVTNKRNGTGLGLAICKQIMEKNIGDINFTSQKGETKFTLSIKKDSGRTVAV